MCLSRLRGDEMQRRCEECNQSKNELPFWVEYLDNKMNIIEERKTCKDCRFGFISKMSFGPERKLRVIGSGPSFKKGNYVYQRVHIVGNPISGQMELF